MKSSKKLAIAGLLGRAYMRSRAFFDIGRGYTYNVCNACDLYRRGGIRLSRGGYRRFNIYRARRVRRAGVFRL